MRVVAQTSSPDRKNLCFAKKSASFIALLFSLVMFTIPWEQLAGREFEDKEVYVENFIYLQSFGNEKEHANLKDFFFNEALWDVVVLNASSFFEVPVVTVLNAITFLCLFSFSRYLIKRHGAISVLFLVNPLVVDFAFSQLRLALAISLVMLAMSLRRRAWMLAVIVIACFIHTATLLFIAMWIVSSKIISRLDRWRAPVVLWALSVIGIGIMVSLIIGPFREGLLSYFGDRRVEYDLKAASFLYVSYWLFALLLVPLQKKNYFRDGANLLAVACMSTLVGATILGVTGIRFVSAVFPLVVSSLLTMAQPLNSLLALGLLSYSGLQWFYWFQ